MSRFRDSARAVALVISALVVIAACGSASSKSSSVRPGDHATPPPSLRPDTSSSTAPAPPAPTAPAVRSKLPVVDVFDAATGVTQAFSELAPSERPILLWFWAPH